MHSTFIAFQFDGEPDHVRGHPSSHLLAVARKHRGSEQTLEFFFSGEIIRVKGTGLERLQVSLLTGQHPQEFDGTVDWTVTSVTRHYYGE